MVLASSEVWMPVTAIVVAVVTAGFSYASARKAASITQMASIDQRVVALQKDVYRLDAELASCVRERDQLYEENIRLMKMILKNGTKEA